jgi:hypothetical protein
MTITGYATKVINDGFPFTRQTIEQGAFSNIRTTNNGYYSIHPAKIR